MARKNATFTNAAADTEAAPLRRSTRKRKEVNYTDTRKGLVEDAMEPPSKKAKKIKATKKIDIAAVDEDEQSPYFQEQQPKKSNGGKGKEVAGTGTLAQLDEAEHPAPAVQQPKPKNTRPVYDVSERGDKRKKPFQAEPPENFESKKNRALSEPIAILGRDRSDNSEVFEMNGSAGARYAVTIQSVPSCTCRDFKFRRQSCKHIIYVLHYALKVPEDSELLYQYAFTIPELEQLLSDATAAPIVSPEDFYKDNKRKTIEGECPICYMDFDPSKEAIDYCKASCGNNVHAKCMKIWISSQQASYGKATCPLCRNNWVQ